MSESGKEGKVEGLEVFVGQSRRTNAPASSLVSFLPAALTVRTRRNRCLSSTGCSSFGAAAEEGAAAVAAIEESLSCVIASSFKV
jgi:hypothetical protein